MVEDKKNRINAKAYQRYLSGNMTPAEKHAFERAMLDDPFAQEALDGMESMDSEHIVEDLKLLKDQLAQRTQKKEQPLFWRIAAGLVLLGIFSFIIYFFIDKGAPTELAQEKPAPSEKSDTMAVLKSKSDSILIEKPDQVIAYQQPLQEKKPTGARTAPESEITTEDILTEEYNEVDPLLDIAAPSEAETKIANNEATEEKMAEIPAVAASPDLLTEMKKEDALPSQKRKADSAKQREIAGAVANVTSEGIIRGKVISAEDDSPVPGVNVIIKGTSNGTVTDVDGYYEIPVSAADNTTLVFNSVGYVSEEIEVSGASHVDVILNSDVTALSEIVVSGYSTSKDETPPYSFTPPGPIGGQKQFSNYIKQNILYPESGLAEQVKGTVKIQFTVTATGNMINIRVIRSLGDDFDKEALRLLQEGPRWEPAEENGSRVARDVKVTIRFKPPER